MTSPTPPDADITGRFAALHTRQLDSVDSCGLSLDCRFFYQVNVGLVHKTIVDPVVDLASVCVHLST